MFVKDFSSSDDAGGELHDSGSCGEILHSVPVVDSSDDDPWRFKGRSTSAS